MVLAFNEPVIVLSLAEKNRESLGSFGFGGGEGRLVCDYCCPDHTMRWNKNNLLDNPIEGRKPINPLSLVPYQAADSTTLRDTKSEKN
ncbi:hypothetical protein E2C01_021533 [Portunus trituberculatus]|uniref:Uncharacterized protein n=1 Tax=Portunus trituberculatus TaxID=210409 RepID=A0A5B7E2T4_PORTR|nr:hypothetical protein [Portunus trituberculatus]